MVPNYNPENFNGIAIVGLCPGPTDRKEGRPWQGTAGHTLRWALRTANIAPEECWLGHIGATEIPTPEELEQFSAEMAARKPAVIVPAGSGPLSLMTDSSNLLKNRGAVQEATRLVAGTKILPIMHPGDIRKQWKWFTPTVNDLSKAAAEVARGPKIIYPKKRLLINPTLADIRAWIDKYALTADLLSTDIETGWGQMTCIGFASDTENAICIPFVDLRRPNGCYWSLEDELKVVEMAQEVLECPVPKLGQNFLYDLVWLFARYHLKVVNYLHDTRLMHHALYPELPKDLAFLGAAYTSQGPWKDFTKHHKTEKRDDN